MKKLIVCLLLLIGGWTFFHQSSFNAEKILEQSLLKERKFNGQVQVVSADEGRLKAYVMQDDSVPLVAVSFGFAKAGKAYETKEGVALLTEAVLLDGAGQYSRQELRELMKEKGIKLNVSAGRDRLDFTFSYLKETEKEALEVLKAVLFYPKLDKEDLDLARSQYAAVRRQRLESPSYHLGKLIDEHFYGSHPYAKDDIPDEATLAQISSDDIRDYLKKMMGKDNLTVGVAGFKVDDVYTQRLLTEIFGDLPEYAQTSDLPTFTPNFTDAAVDNTLDTSAQSFVLMMAKGIKRLDEDFYPLYIADYIFGGSGLNSKLNQTVREKNGLTYGIYSYFSNSDAVDLWQIYFSATPNKVSTAIKLANEEYQKFYQNGVSADDLAQAKRGLMASFNLRFASLINIADMLKFMQVHQLGEDFLLKRQSMVEKVTLEDVNRAIRKKMPKSLTAADGVRLFELKAGSASHP